MCNVNDTLHKMYFMKSAAEQYNIQNNYMWKSI